MEKQKGLFLVAATLLMAISGLIYELLAGALSSYLLGDSTTQFSLVIGVFLSCMGLGSWSSRFITRNHLVWLIGIEIAVGIIGGSIALCGFAAFAYTSLYQVVLLGMTGIVGVLVGLEIPVVIAVLKNTNSPEANISNVLSADYVGALVASLLFPFLLVPHLGLNKAGLVAGASNIAIALVLAYKFRRSLRRSFGSLMTAGAVSLGILATFYVTSGTLISHMEDQVYQDRIIFAKNSPFQRIVLTRWRKDLRLYLNGHLQFSSVDEYRYHETLVHLPMSLRKAPESVLVLGGGDGLALRELLKYPQIQSITLVDLDPEVTGLFQTHPLLTRLNQNALNHPKVKILHQDAMQFLHEDQASFDLILSDLPDPSDPGLAKLFSRSFFGLAMRKLRPGGLLMTQSTSPFRSRSAFWCIHNTLASLGTHERPVYVKALHVQVPTFGKWGFNLASFDPIDPTKLRLRVPTKFLSNDFVPSMFVFSKDTAAMSTPISTLNDPVIARLYQDGYHKYLE